MSLGTVAVMVVVSVTLTLVHEIFVRVSDSSVTRVVPVV